MADATSHPFSSGGFTAEELRAAMRLLDPAYTVPDTVIEQIATSPPESPWLLPHRVVVALAVVSERIGRAADAALASAAPEYREWFRHERQFLERVARGEAPPPGLGT